MANYDPSIIQEYADKLYSRADFIILGWTVFGAIVGYLAGSMLGGEGMRLFAVIIGGALGYGVGEQRAFLLKLQAQLALCQVEIERNGRVAAESPAELGADPVS
ncbi:MAG TPA: hypothetical protein VFR28_10160 [Allosphingosinicella sp.]|nr:hypothetical protein [Allosphingosinicella sp.]